jgi:hypothetical protein
MSKEVGEKQLAQHERKIINDFGSCPVRPEVLEGLNCHAACL